MEKKNQMSIVLFGGTVDKLLAASVLASGAIANGMQVKLFLTTWGLMAFRRGDWETNDRISADFAEMKGAMMQAAREKKISWMHNLRQAKELGELEVIACGLTMEMFGLSKNDLEDIVDRDGGVAEFMAEAETSSVSLFI